MRSLETALPGLTEGDISRIVEMAWEDRTAFEAIEVQFGLNESAVVALMRRQMKASSFRMWRKRMAGRVTKHAALFSANVADHAAPLPSSLSPSSFPLPRATFARRRP